MIYNLAMPDCRQTQLLTVDLDLWYNTGRDIRAVRSAVDRFVHTEEVTGSNPVPPTIVEPFAAIRAQNSGFVPTCATCARVDC